MRNVLFFVLVIGLGARAAEPETLLNRELGAAEQGVDHAGLIRAWDDQSFERGESLYQSLCLSCHGTQELPGSLPTSRAFWKEPFKNGGDPFNMYKTLTLGFGQMPAWGEVLTPEQRYDVIHYVREALVKPNNPAAYTAIDALYLGGLPEAKGTFQKTAAMVEFEKGPKYLRMNFGPALFWTYEVAPNNIAYKGIAIRLDDGPGGISKGRVWMLYDHDTMRMAAGWAGTNFIDWKGIAFDGSHGTHASIVGEKGFMNPVGPGWADPRTGSFEDLRIRGRDGKPYGPLSREWTHFKGVFLNGNKVVVSYTVGDAEIRELPSYKKSGQEISYVRRIELGKSSRDLLMRVAPETAPVAVDGPAAVRLIRRDGFNLLSIPAAATPVDLVVEVNATIGTALAAEIPDRAGVGDERIESLTQGGPARWKQVFIVEGDVGTDSGPFAVDEIPTPPNHENPWQTWMRLSGLDFFKDGKRAAVSTWMGDVWLVSGIDGDLGQVTWRRIASGLFQPLGVKIVDDTIYVGCRDQIVRLKDLNGDGEIDFYENFNNDHQVTEHFHEFAMGLQTDDDGNFYYAKSARHALPAIVPHHGTLLKVSKDGSTTEILANGFRAANGVCLNADGTFFVTDQEGHWIPKNRINLVRRGGFYGNMMAYSHPESSADSAMEQPMVWITNAKDRSPGELVWVTSEQWGPLRGSLLNLSYGTGRIFVVPHENVRGQLQGGVVELPIEELPTGVMRGRFHPQNGQLYACGMFAWAGNRQADGGLYRVRYTGKPVYLPVGLRATTHGLELTFTGALNRADAEDPKNYQVKVWSLKRGANYGSNHHDERSLAVSAASLSNDGKTVRLRVPEIQPTWCMEIKYQLRSSTDTPVTQSIHNTIHALSEERSL